MKQYNEAAVFGKSFRRNKTNPYRDVPIGTLMQIGKRYGINEGGEDRLDDWTRIINDYYLLEHPYLSLPMSELKVVAQKRNIHPGDHECKPDLVDALEKADNELVFDLMGLSAELRAIIYRFAFLQKHKFRKDKSSVNLYRLPSTDDYFRRSADSLERPYSAYGTGNGALIEHPITRVSRQVRQESLPIFYQTRRFPILHLLYHSRPWRSLPLFEKTDLSRPWLCENGLSREKLAWIGSFLITLRIGPGDYTIAWNIDIDFCKKTSNYEIKWYTNDGEPEELLLPDTATVAHYVTMIRKQVDVISKSPGIGNFGREEVIELFNVVKDEGTRFL